MNVFNPAQFRAQFPALQDAGVYLDSAATALKPEAVVEATRQFYSLSAGNVHRSQFAEAQRLTARYEAAREKVASLINAPDDKTIVWTRGTTEAINMVAQSYARPRLQPGDEIIVSAAEHHANLVPWLMVAEQTGAKVVRLPLNAHLLPDVESLAQLITPRSRILALGQMSNVTGGCPDLARAITLAHAAGMVVMVDGAQGIVHFPADVQQLDIDFYAFSGHKLYGPTGIGVLYGRAELLEQMPPWQTGGEMIERVSLASQEQSTGVGQVGQAVTQMDQTTQQNAALVEQMAAAASSLHGQAQELVQAVAVFKLHPGESLGHGVLKVAPAAAPIAAPKPAVKAPVRKTAPPAAGKPAALPKAKAAGGDDDWESF